jgi:hypothetical protein
MGDTKDKHETIDMRLHIINGRLADINPWHEDAALAMMSIVALVAAAAFTTHGLVMHARWSAAFAVFMLWVATAIRAFVYKRAANHLGQALFIALRGSKDLGGN